MTATRHTEADLSDAGGAQARDRIDAGRVGLLLARRVAALVVEIELEAVTRRRDAASGAAQRHRHNAVHVEQQDGHTDGDGQTGQHGGDEHLRDWRLEIALS